MTDFTVTVNGQPVVVKGAPSQEEAQRFAMKSAGTQPDSKATEEGKAAGEEDGFAAHANNIVRQIAKGASFGGADMLAAGADAATHGLLGRGSDAPDLSSRYNENLARERGQTKGFQEQNPHATTAANIVGNIMGAMALGRAGLPVAPQAATLPRTMAKSAMVGGGLGGTQGFLEGEGGFQNRVANAGPQALGGAAAGALVPAIAKGAGALMDTGPGHWLQNNIMYPAADAAGGAWNAVKNAFHGASPSTMAEGGAAHAAGDLAGETQLFASPPENRAAEDVARKRLADILQQSKADPQALVQRLQSLGPEATPMDVTGASGQRAVRGETITNADLQDHVINMLKNREKGGANAMRGAFEGPNPPPSRHELLGENGEGGLYDKFRDTVADPAYDRMRASGLTTSPEMEEVLGRSSGAKDALDEITANKIKWGQPANPIDAADALKQHLNDVTKVARQGGKVIGSGHDVGSIANDWERAFWNTNPEAERASGIYREASKNPDYFRMGYGFRSGGPSENAANFSLPAVEEKLADANLFQHGSAQQGVVNNVRDTVKDPTTANRLANELMNSSNVPGSPANRLRAIMGEDRARQIMDEAAKRQTFNQTYNRLGGGSDTAFKQADVANNGGFGNARINLSPHGISERVTEHFGEMAKEVLGASEPSREAFVHMMSSQNPQVNRQNMLLAAELMKRMKSTAAAQAGASAGIGSAATRSE